MNIVGFLVFALLLFLLNWILGGVVYAVASFSYVRKMRIVLFSSLFTLFSLLLAVGFAIFGMVLGKSAIAECGIEAEGMIDRASETIACGATAYTVVAVISVLSTLIVGGVLLKLCVQKAQLPKDGRIAQLVRALH